MKLLATATALVTALALVTPVQAQVFNSGNSGLFGLGNNLLGIQTGHISVLNGGILNGSNVLSGNGVGSGASASNTSTNLTGSGHASAPGGTVVGGSNNTVVPGNGNAIGTGNTVVPGSGNVIGAGNAVGNQWGSNYSYRTFNRFGW